MISKDDLDREAYIEHLSEQEGWALTPEQYDQLWREFKRRALLTRAQKLGLGVLGALVGLSQIAQGVAAVIEALR